MDSLFLIFAAESEGDIPTRMGKIARIIKLGPFSQEAQEIADSLDLTDEEAIFIMKEMSLRY